MPTHIHDNYLITLVHSLSSREYKQDRTEVSNKHMGTVVDYKQKGGLLIRDLWEKGTDCMLDMHVVNTHFKSYQMRPPEKSFMKAEKKRNTIILTPVSNSDGPFPYLWHHLADWLLCKPNPH